MSDDPILLTLVVAAGVALGLILVQMLYAGNRRFRNLSRKIICAVGRHAPSGHFRPAIGGRDVMRCLYCDEIVYEVQRTKDSLRRTR